MYLNLMTRIIAAYELPSRTLRTLRSSGRAAATVLEWRRESPSKYTAKMIRRFALLLSFVALATSATAQRLPKTVVPEHYQLVFTIDLADAKFTGQTGIDVRVTQSTSTITLHAVDRYHQRHGRRGIKPRRHRGVNAEAQTATDGFKAGGRRRGAHRDRLQRRVTAARGSKRTKIQSFVCGHAVRVDRRTARVSLLRRAGVQSDLRRDRHRRPRRHRHLERAHAVRQTGPWRKPAHHGLLDDRENVHLPGGHRTRRFPVRGGLRRQHADPDLRDAGQELARSRSNRPSILTSTTTTTR